MIIKHCLFLRNCKLEHSLPTNSFLHHTPLETIKKTTLRMNFRKSSGITKEMGGGSSDAGVSSQVFIKQELSLIELKSNKLSRKVSAGVF